MDAWTPPNAEYPPPKAGEPPLHRAARLGDHAEIRRSALAGSDLNAVFEMALDPGSGRRDPMTPLMVAAGSGDGATVDTVELLLLLGADPKKLTPGLSPISAAAGGLGWNYRPGGDARRLRTLLAAGSPLPPDPREAHRALCQAAALGDPERVRILLGLGLSAGGHFDGADARARAEQLADRADGLHASRPDPFASLSERARASIDASRAQWRAQSIEAAATAPSPFDIPLFRAAESGCLECVTLLLQAGANALTRDSLGRTAMYVGSTPPIILALAAAGLPTEDAHRFGVSPLADAVSHGALERAQGLIAAGADINASDAEGRTIFMESLRGGLAMARLLVDAGADSRRLDKHGRNALHAAIGSRRDLPSSRQLFSYLLELGVALEHRDRHGDTPLARAVDGGSASDVRALCELGADPNVRCPIHRCNADSCVIAEAPLITAAAAVGVDIDAKIRALLDAGADPRAADAHGLDATAVLVHTIAADDPDPHAAVTRFNQAVAAIPWPPRTAGPDEYWTIARPLAQRALESFAAEIPIPATFQFNARWRLERLAALADLLVALAWTAPTSP